MNQITIGSDRIPRLGYGCMGLTQAYQPVGPGQGKGTPPEGSWVRVRDARYRRHIQRWEK